jgi:hypothetical protein
VCSYLLKVLDNAVLSAPSLRVDIVISSQVLFTMEVYYTESSIHNS